MKYIHPFPARMAPELALNTIQRLKPNSIILDPMMGSGTVIREALINGHSAIGYDLDPLALLISKVSNCPFNLGEFENYAKKFVSLIKSSKERDFVLTWIDDDRETTAFIDFWYASSQKSDLRKISYFIFSETSSKNVPPIFIDTLKVALSRIIITKEMKASLARDTAHSRPHKVSIVNEFDVVNGFEFSIKAVIKILSGYFPSFKASASIYQGDARNMNLLSTGSVDTIITSPPYLNAIDYLRGHKFSLIWFGYCLNDIRNIKDNTVGIEKLLIGDTASPNIINAIDQSSNFLGHTKKDQKTILKYAVDLNNVLKEYRRVIRAGGYATFVVANSNIKNSIVDNSNIVRLLAEDLNFKLKANLTREIPTQGRYLPVSLKDNNPLYNRMKHESVMTFLAN